MGKTTPTPQDVSQDEQRERDGRDAQKQSSAGSGNLLLDFFMMLIKAIMGSLTDTTSEYSEIDRENAAAPEPGRATNAGRILLSSETQAKLHALAQKYTTLPEAISPFTVNAAVTSNLGKRPTPLAGASHDHQGIDIAPREQSPEASIIHSTMPGIVVRSETQRDKNGKVAGFGNWVEVACIDGTRRRYAHLKELGAPVGTVLDQGAVVGIMGNTGTSEAPHLHYEVRDADGKTQEPVINNVTYRWNDRSYIGSTVKASHVTPGEVNAAPQAAAKPAVQATTPTADVVAKVKDLGLSSEKMPVTDAAQSAVNMLPSGMRAAITSIGKTFLG